MYEVQRYHAPPPAPVWPSEPIVYCWGFDPASSVSSFTSCSCDFCESFHENFGQFGPPGNRYRDFRSVTKAKNRLLKQRQKYYGWRAVRPEWVGLRYYTLALTSPDPSVNPEPRRSQKANKKRRWQQAEEEENEIEHPHLLEKLEYVCWSFDCSAWIERAGWLNDAHRKENGTQVPPVGTTIASPIVDDLFELALQYMDFNPIGTIVQDTIRNISGTRLKLKVMEWTVLDNFNNKEYFSGGGTPDIRHHRGRRHRSGRPCYHKWTLCNMERSTKTWARRTDAVGSQWDVVKGRRKHDWEDEGRPYGAICPCASRACEFDDIDKGSVNLRDDLWLDRMLPDPEASELEEKESYNLLDYVRQGNGGSRAKQDSMPDANGEKKQETGIEPQAKTNPESELLRSEDDWVLFDITSHADSDYDTMSDRAKTIVEVEWEVLSNDSDFG